MTENKNLRALLQEASAWLIADQKLNKDYAKSVMELRQRIDDALRMSEDQISIECLRENVTRVPIATLADVEEAYDLGWCNGAKAMREAAAKVATEITFDFYDDDAGKAIREMPTPEIDKKGTL